MTRFFLIFFSLFFQVWSHRYIVFTTNIVFEGDCVLYMCAEQQKEREKEKRKRNCTSDDNVYIQFLIMSNICEYANRLTIMIYLHSSHLPSHLHPEWCSALRHSLLFMTLTSRKKEITNKKETTTFDNALLHFFSSTVCVYACVD